MTQDGNTDEPHWVYSFFVRSYFPSPPPSPPPPEETELLRRVGIIGLNEWTQRTGPQHGRRIVCSRNDRSYAFTYVRPSHSSPEGAGLNDRTWFLSLFFFFLFITGSSRKAIE